MHVSSQLVSRAEWTPGSADLGLDAGSATHSRVVLAVTAPLCALTSTSLRWSWDTARTSKGSFEEKCLEAKSSHSTQPGQLS